MEDLKKFFIDGKWIIPNSTNIFPVIDPSNEKIFAEIILGNDKDVEAAVYAAKKAFNIFSSFSKGDRLKLLENLLSVMEKRFEEINLKAINSALSARKETNKNDVLIAGSISHRYPIADGDILSQAIVNVSKNELQDSTYEMLHLLSNNGCDLILLEMMYRPERMEVVFDVMRKSKILILSRI